MELPKMKTDHYQPVMFVIDHYYLFQNTKNTNIKNKKWKKEKKQNWKNEKGILKYRIRNISNKQRQFSFKHFFQYEKCTIK